MSKKGFTLAEILITLTVIGVVAALTIPSLLQKTNDAEFKAAWKKDFADLNQAFLLVRQDEDVSQYFTCTAYYCTYPLIPKIIAKYPSNVLKESSWGNIYNFVTYKSITGVPFAGAVLHAAYQMVNGTTLYYWTFNAGQASLWIDVNGYQKGPNILGKDLFAVYLANDKILPYGADNTGIRVNSCDGVASSFPYSVQTAGTPGTGTYAGIGCSARYLYE